MYFTGSYWFPWKHHHCDQSESSWLWRLEAVLRVIRCSCDVIFSMKKGDENFQKKKICALQTAASFACNRPSERHVRDGNAAASRGEVEELERELCRAENKKRGVQPEECKTSPPPSRKGGVLVRRRGACRRPQERGRESDPPPRPGDLEHRTC